MTKNKKRNKKRRISFWSIVVGIMVGYFIGWYLDGVLPILFKNITIFYYAIPMISFAYMGWKKPITTEFTGFAVSIWVLFQYVWDYKVLDRGSIRFSMFVIAIILFSLNLFTGKVKWKGAIKTFKNAVGLT